MSPRAVVPGGNLPVGAPGIGEEFNSGREGMDAEADKKLTTKDVTTFTYVNPLVC